MKEIEQFERGEMGWNDLPAQARKFYLDNYPHESIIVGEDENGPVSVADAQHHFSGSWIFGGGKDKQGHLGRFGDYLGQFGDYLGLTDYAGSAARRDYAQAQKAPNAALDNINAYVQENGLPGYYQDPTLAEQSPETQEAQSQFSRAGQNKESDVNSARDNYLSILSGDDQYTNDLASQASANNQHGFLKSGTFNSSAANKAGVAAAANTIGAQRIAALQGLNNLDYGKAGNLTGTAGRSIDDYNQAGINEDIKKFNYEENAPYQNLLTQYALANANAANLTPPPAKKSLGDRLGAFAGTVGSIAKIASLFNEGGSVQTKPSLMKRRF